MTNTTIDIFNAFAKLDEYICMLFLPRYHTHINLTSLGKKKQGTELRENFCDSIPGEKEVFIAFKNVTEEISQRLSDGISIVLHSNWGYSDMHPGVAPTDFIKPGGNGKDDHRPVIDGTKYSPFVVQQHELKKGKYLEKIMDLKRWRIF